MRMAEWDCGADAGEQRGRFCWRAEGSSSDGSACPIVCRRDLLQQYMHAVKVSDRCGGRC